MKTSKKDKMVFVAVSMVVLIIFTAVPEDAREGARAMIELATLLLLVYVIMRDSHNAEEAKKDREASDARFEAMLERSDKRWEEIMDRWERMRAEEKELERKARRRYRRY